MSVVLSPSPILMEPNDTQARYSFAPDTRHKTFDAEARHGTTPASFFSSHSKQQQQQQQQSVRPEIVSPTAAAAQQKNHSPPMMTAYPPPHQTQHRQQFHARLPSLQTILSPPPDERPSRSPQRFSEHVNDYSVPYPHPYTSPPTSSSGPSSLNKPQEHHHTYSRPSTQSGPTSDHQQNRWDASLVDTVGSAGTRSPYSDTASSVHYSAAPSSDLHTLPALHHRSHASSTTNPPRSSHTRSSSEQSGSDRAPSPRDFAPRGDQRRTSITTTTTTTTTAAATAPAVPTGSRVTCVQNIEREGGPCYVYADGTYCRTEIAGEPVNPEWGVTKAGKPRKRLAQACISCREKKIKCEPGYPKCNQCKKLGRECRRSTNSRSSPDGANGEQRPGNYERSEDDGRERSITPRRMSSGSRPQSFDKERARSASPIEQDSPIWRLPKRVCTSVESRASGYAATTTTTSTSTTSTTTASAPATATATEGGISMSSEVGARSLNQKQIIARLNCDTDPFDIIPDICIELVRLAFINNAEGSVYTLYPREAIYRWLRDTRRKSKDDIILIYSLMALGFAFDFHADALTKAVGARVAEIASMAVHEKLGQTGGHSVQLVQSRLLLHVYYVSRGKIAEAWEQLGATVRLILSLNLNKESGILSLPLSSLERYLDERQVYESRRRTFWFAYLMNCYSGFFRGRVGLINEADIFLRLPNNEQDYIDRCVHVGPLFDGGRIEWRAVPNSRMGSMAMLVGVTCIFDSVFAHAYRAVNGSRLEDAASYEAFYEQTKTRLDEWRQSLPDEMQNNGANFSQAHSERRFATYFNLHMVHYATAIALARYGPVKNLSSTTIRRNICEAYRNTRSLLTITNAVCRDHLDGNGRTADVEQSLSQPFLGYCVVIACDVACSGGKVESLQTTIACLSNVIRILDEVARLWGLARQQSYAINESLCDLSAHAMSDGRDFWRSGNKRAWFDVGGPPSFSPDYDIIVGSSTDLYHEAITEFTSKG